MEALAKEAAPRVLPTMIVPVSNPAHPSHIQWLQIILTVLQAATSIGPAVVAIVDPKDAALAGKVAGLAGAVITPLSSLQTPSTP